jgi:hypothetical protein
MRARARQLPEVAPGGEAQGASRGDEQQRCLDAASADAIENHSQRNLGGGEGEEVRAGEKTHRTCGQRELLVQGRSDDRVGRPEEERDEVPCREWEHQAYRDGEWEGRSGAAAVPQHVICLRWCHGGKRGAGG